MKRAPGSLHGRIALWVAASLVASCSSTQLIPVDPDQAGTYGLVSVDGAAIPATVAHGGARLEVRSGTFTIRTDGTCSTTTVFVPPARAEVTRTVHASYARDGARLTMRWKGAGTTTATIDGPTLAMENEGMLFVYRK